MPKPTRSGFAPLRVAGHDIEVTLTADQFWGWGQIAEIARDAIGSNPDHARKLLDQLIDDMGRRYASARKDDPTLPDHYRAHLQQ